MANMEQEIKIILIGMTGSGKSSVGNLLLRQQVFEVGRTGITRTSQLERLKLVDGRQLVIVDTPGYSNIHLTEEETQEEINGGMELLAPGPHITIYVQSLRQPLTQCDVKVLQTLTEKFDKDSNHFFILFSGIDDIDKNARTVTEFIEKNKELTIVLNKKNPDPVCSKRFDDTTQYDLLIQAIKTNCNVDLEKVKIGQPDTDETAIESAGVKNPPTNDTRCIILVGTSEIGKSSLAKMLLNTTKEEKKEFKACHIMQANGMVVVVTHGFSADENENENAAKSILNTIGKNNWSLNVCILVLSADERLSEDKIGEEVEVIKKRFGGNDNMMIVFNGEDYVNNEYLDEHKSPIPRFLLDCKDGKQEEVVKILKEIFSEKYKVNPFASGLTQSSGRKYKTRVSCFKWH